MVIPPKKGFLYLHFEGTTTTFTLVQVLLSLNNFLIHPLHRCTTQRISLIQPIAYRTFIMPCQVLWCILIIHFMHIINTTLITILIRLMMRTRAKVTRILNEYLIVLLLVNYLLRDLLILFFFMNLISR